MILSEEKAKEILNLHTSERVSKEIADRQFKVAVKAFNHLYQPENKYVYIADEVGLGKTYIAMGIATLIQHFSDNLENFNGMVIVPKENLQYKWVSEFNKFIKNNYKKSDNRVKSITNQPISKLDRNQIYPNLKFINNSPSYHFYRNSSFSLSNNSENYQKWKERLLSTIPDIHHSLFEAAWNYLKNTSSEEDFNLEIRKLYSYILNTTLPPIDILIVDEAHNFKHGIGDKVSYRNNVLSRFLGVIQNDNKIFERFPELKEKTKPKVKNIIFLSATPIDKSLVEIKNQLDCFFLRHEFSNIEEDKLENHIKENLQKFFIRGLMRLELDSGCSYTRNQYRYEHRNGNVLRIPAQNSNPLVMKDGIQSLVTSLVQYKTLKHLTKDNKANASFEIGLLAGFETFSGKNILKNKKEYENTRDKSVDADLISEINNSYLEQFKSNLPHPKQDALLDELYRRMINQEKALVFVNRIASAHEIESKLTHRYEKFLVEKIRELNINDPRVNHMLKMYDEISLSKYLEETLYKLSERIYENEKHELIKILTNPERQVAINSIKNCLLFLYEGELQDDEINTFRNKSKEKVNYVRFDSEYRNFCYRLFLKYYQDYVEDSNESEDDDPDQDPYFFRKYFSSSKENRYPGKNFRKLLYTKDWFEINIAVLDKKLDFNYGKSPSLQSKPEYDDKVKDKEEIDKFNSLMDSFVRECRENNKSTKLTIIHNDYLKETFLTKLLLEELNDPFLELVDRVPCEIKNNPSKFQEELNYLSTIIKYIFWYGSGLLPAYLSYIYKKDLDESSIKFIKQHFPKILSEIKTILDDYELLKDVNFSDTDNIKFILTNQSPVVGVSGGFSRNISKIAAQFRMPGYPYILITTDILREGEDLHTYCSDIFHYGVAWTPSIMEQRTGRIDRISSLSNRNLQEDKVLNFNNKLQVFFPYLSDTLEVNQISRVFNNMNRFVEAFYDNTKIPEKENLANVNDLVESIPPQIRTKLKSKYDIDNFNPTVRDTAELQILPTNGNKAIDVKSTFKKLFSILKSKYKDNMKIHRDDNYFVKGDIFENNRRWPFIARVINSNIPGEFDIEISSLICRKSELKTKVNLENLKNESSELELNLESINEYLWARNIISISSDINSIVEKFDYVCRKADALEKEYTGKDDTEFVL